MIDLESRLSDLGDSLDLDETADLASAVVTRLAAPTGDGPAEKTWSRRAVGLRVAAALVLVTAVLVAVPGSRQAIAEWFGLDGVTIDRDPTLSPPPETPPLAGSPGDGTVVDVDGAEVLVSALDGRLDEGVISKTLGPDTGIERVDVAGNLGLWIDGEPHVVSYRSDDGEIVSERFAGNTLLWQDGDVIRRVEGFATLADALAFATTRR